MKNLILIVATICLLSGLSAAQTTAFNFQGRLNDGTSPANGRYDLQFKLYDAIAGGNQVGAIVSKPNLLLINGVFSTQLDFGAAAFAGGDRFLEIQLRPAGSSNAYVVLGARQQILSVPYSVKSFNATNADNATTAQNAVNAQNATNATNAQTAVNSTNATNATTAQTAVNSQQLGGVAASQFIQRGGIGTAKAMLSVNFAGNISRCYNSTLSGSAATTVPCGFSTTEFTEGGFGINFGFNTANTFVSIATARPGSGQSNLPAYSTFQYPGSSFPQNINVFTWNEDGSVSSGAYFMIIVY